MLCLCLLSWIEKARHIYICDEHKNTIQHLRNQTKNRDASHAGDIRVDLSDKSIHSEVIFSVDI